MNVKFVLDDFSSSRNEDVVRDVLRELGSKATVSGKVISVDDWDSQRVAEILSRHGVNYSRKSGW